MGVVSSGNFLLSAQSLSKTVIIKAMEGRIWRGCPSRGRFRRRVTSRQYGSIAQAMQNFWTSHHSTHFTSFLLVFHHFRNFDFRQSVVICWENNLVAKSFVAKALEEKGDSFISHSCPLPFESVIFSVNYKYKHKHHFLDLWLSFIVLRTSFSEKPFSGLFLLVHLFFRFECANLFFYSIPFSITIMAATLWPRLSCNSLFLSPVISLFLLSYH